MTPRPVARFMASLFGEAGSGQIKLLDAGAGVGSLTAAFVEEFCQRDSHVSSIVATAYEVDPIMEEARKTTLAECGQVCQSAGIRFDSHLSKEDFVQSGTSQLLTSPGPLFPETSTASKFTHAILNPPYKKIHSDSTHRQLLRSACIETSNLYAGLLSLVIRMLENNGEMVAITPRSFCNGPYFKPFRKLLIEKMSLRQIHVFESRTDAFRDDDVLQESVIIHAVRNQPQSEVTISVSEDAGFSRLRSRNVDFAEIIVPQAPEPFIHIITDNRDLRFVERMYSLPNILKGLIYFSSQVGQMSVDRTHFCDSIERSLQDLSTSLTTSLSLKFPIPATLRFRVQDGPRDVFWSVRNGIGEFKGRTTNGAFWAWINRLLQVFLWN